MKKLMLLLTVLALTSSGTQAQDAAFVKLSHYDFQETLEMIKEKASEAGWAVPAEHDMQAILKTQDKDVLPSTIIVLCNAQFAYKLLNNDNTRKAQTLLPCRVAVYEKADGKTYVAWSNYTKAGKELTPEAAPVFKEIAKGVREITASVTK